MPANKKILLVEDDELTIKTAGFVLAQEGYEMSYAKDGEEAEKMLANPVDLILLDLLLPKKSGFEILKIIRQKKIAVPVIVFSNLGNNADIERALKLGAMDYLIKNELSISKLKEKIKKVLNYK